MANLKISQLPQGEFSPESIFPFVYNGVTSQNTFENLVTALNPHFSGSSQDLQQTIENGGMATFNSGNTVVRIFNGPSRDLFQIYNKTELGAIANMNLTDGTFFVGSNSADDTRSSTLSLNNGAFILSQRFNNVSSSLYFEDPTSNASFKIPTKPNAIYTIATLEDILLLGSLIPTYADNAAAITGGLGVNNPYKTPTGEIRVRV